MDSTLITGNSTDMPTNAVPTELAPLSEQAAKLDALNPIAYTRDRFLIPADTVYLDGNSLGALPAAVPAAVEDAVRRQWGQGLISSWWDEDWWEAPLRIGNQIGALIGAAPGQVVSGDSTSVQLFNTVAAAARLRAGRRILLTDPNHFPTDAYLTDSVAELL